MKLLKPLAIVALLVYAGIRPAAAQNSTIQGIVTDQSSAVVPGVQVTVTNIATGVANALQTNESGFYSVPLLDAGTYRVEASKQGFAPVKRDGLKLDVGQTARVDFTLKVGAVAETVEVTAALAPIDSQTSTVGQVINNQQIVELPLNGRNYLQLARLTAAVAPSNGSRTDAKGSFSALGQHGLQTNIMLDGVDNNSRFSGGQLGFEAQGVTPSIDAVQEFKVVTNNNSAEYGFRMGGTVIVSTKSGTNEFHGSAYEFFRNDKLDGANFFAVGQPKPAFRRNQFGATVGGPVIKNRTFFFASYEGTRIRQGSSSISTLPTVAMRNGDFSATRPIFDPMTTRQDATGKYVRDLFAGNQIPASRFDPVSQKVIALYPIPSLPGIVNNNFFSGSHKDDTDEIDTRVDHNLSDKHRIFGRYSRRHENSLDPGPLPLPADGGLWTTTDVIAHSVVANLNSTLTPTLNNEVRFGFNKIDSLLDIPWTTGLDSQLGIKGVPDLGDITSRGMARFSPTGYTEVGARSFWPNPNNLHVLQLSDQLLQVHGRHMLKMGFAFTRELIYRNSSRLSRGQFAFNGSFTQDPNNRGNTGDGMADFLLGIASGGTIGNRNGETAVTHNYSAFFQDDWRITNRLTLNLGVRWDEFGPPTFPDSVVSRLEIFPGPNFNQFVYPKNDGDCGCTHELRDFAPRLGFAFQLTPKTVLRSGFGMFYGEPDSIAHDGTERFWNQAPAFTEISFPTDRLLQPALIVQDGFPGGLLPTTKLQPNVLARSAFPFIPTQYSMQWFYDLQRELPLQTVVTLSYIGSGTRHLVQTLDANQPLTPGLGAIQPRRPRPFFAGLTLMDPLGNASYQAVTAKAEKRYSQGLNLLAAYTYSHSIDDAIETDTLAGGEGLQNNYDVRRARGNSVFDVRQQFVMSGVYDLPAGSGRKWMNRKGPADWLLGGWQLGGIVTLRTGIPFTPLVSTDISNTGTTNHPNRAGNGNLSGSDRSIQRWFDTAAFAIPEAYTYGNGGRDILYGPNFNNLDLKIAKNFRVTEAKRVEFRFEMFNATNTPHFNLPNANVNLPQGGKITSAGEPRDIQLGLKFVY